MRRDDIVEAVLKATEVDKKKTAHAAVETVFDAISKALSRGEDVGISGFGTFRVVKRAARMGVNPKTGEKLQIPAARVPKFRAGKALKEAVK